MTKNNGNLIFNFFIIPTVISVLFSTKERKVLNIILRNMLELLGKLRFFLNLFFLNKN